MTLVWLLPLLMGLMQRLAYIVYSRPNCYACYSNVSLDACLFIAI